MLCRTEIWRKSKPQRTSYQGPLPPITPYPQSQHKLTIHPTPIHPPLHIPPNPRNDPPLIPHNPHQNTHTQNPKITPPPPPPPTPRLSTSPAISATTSHISPTTPSHRSFSSALNSPSHIEKACPRAVVHD